MTQLRIAIVLAMAVALGPFAIDTYLPSFPHIAQTMHTDINAIGFSVSVYVFGLAFGQLLGGPLSDRWGRANVMLIGLAIFSLASILLAFSSNLSELLVLRTLQAFGGGWTVVTVPAIVRDRTEGQEAAKLFSLIGLIMIIAPAIAPSIGTLLLLFSNWPTIFIFLAGYALLVMGLAKFIIFSTPVSNPIKPNTRINFISQYAKVLRLNVAIYFILLQAFAWSVMLIFLTNASFIYQQHFATSNIIFSIFFLLNIATMACLNRVARILLKWYAPITILSGSIILQCMAVLALILIVLFHSTLSFLVPAMMIAVGSLGAISPNIQACFLQFYKENSGTAAALLGATQLSIGGCMSALSTFFANGTLFPFVLTMGVCSLLCLLLIWRVIILMQKKQTY